MDISEIRAHFDAIAPRYRALKARNRYYHRCLIRWCRAMAPPNRKVLDVGCGRGDVLAALAPSVGLGLDVSPAMVAGALADHQGYAFRAGAIEDFHGDASFDTALCINTLEYASDPAAVLRQIHGALRDNGRLLVTTANPLWSPIFKAASALGLRAPDCQRLFIPRRDLVAMLDQQGFQVVYDQINLAFPKWIPGLSRLINLVVSRTPLLRLLGSTQFIVARKVPPARRDYSVSVIMPCYNERDSVEACARSVRPLGLATEVIVVDDGSTDGTVAAVRAHLNPAVGVRLLSFQTPRGKSEAVIAGCAAAKGDVIVIVDADLTPHPEELERLYEVFATGGAEFVNGSRFAGRMEGGAVRRASYIGSRAVAVLVSAIMERPVSDTHSGTKALFRRDYRYMTMGRDPWGDYDLLFGAAQLRLVFHELPVHDRQWAGGSPRRTAIRRTANLVRMCWVGFWQIKTLRRL